MSAILRILSKDAAGTLSSEIFPIDKILHTAITIREQDKDSIESKISGEEKGPAVEYSEYSLKVTLLNGTEYEIDAINNICEFQIRNTKGVVAIETDSLEKLDEVLMAIHAE